MDKVAQPSRRDVPMGAYSSGLTPEKLSSIHYSADIGQIEQAMTLYADVIGKDLHVDGILDKSKERWQAVSGKLYPARTMPKGKRTLN